MRLPGVPTAYREAMAEPGVRRVVAALFVCYLASGMVSVALLLAAERVTGSYAVAGAVAALYALALALGSPAWGRVADRRGPRQALAAAAVLQAAALAGFVVVALGPRSAWGLLVAATIAGAATPPSSSVAKRVFTAAGHPDRRRGLLAVTGLFAEVVFVLGPLVVAAVAAIAGPPFAVVATAATGLLGVCWLRGAPAVRALVPTAPAGRGGEPRGWSAGQLHVLAVTVLGAVAIGAVQVSAVAHADSIGASAGVLVAVIACGGVVASFLYGAVAVPGPLHVHLGLCLVAYGALIATMGLTPGLLISVVLLVMVGAATGPADTLESLLIAQRSPADSQTQAFSMLVTANWIGFAAGSAAAGALIQHLSVGAGFLCGAVAALLAGAYMLVPRPRRQ